MDFIVSRGTRSAGLPFSDAVKLGDLLCISGQIGNRPGTLELVPGGIEAETRQMMENIARILNAEGRSFDDVFKCTVMLADITQWREFNKVYLQYFKPERLPARSAFGANGLALGAAVEMECWASIGEPMGT
ncbi:MAG TPA: RidA family protein [Rhizomicrobium sp.]|jgi:reactive intermediate/imine deaminase|nr:RidA family protein [Rhizomicrobium sp.]